MGNYAMMNQCIITQSKMYDELFYCESPWIYERGRFSCAFKFAEIWKVLSGSATIKNMDGKTIIIQKDDYIKFNPNVKLSFYVQNKLIVCKVCLDEKHRKEIKENQQINYSIIDIILRSLNFYQEYQDEFLTAGYKIEEIVRCGKQGDIYKCTNNKKHLIAGINMISDMLGIPKDILTGNIRLKTGFVCTDVNLMTMYGYMENKRCSIDTIGITDKMNVGDLLLNPLLLDAEDEEQYKMIDSCVYTAENLIKLKVAEILRKNRLLRDLRFSFKPDDEMLPYLGQNSLPKDINYSTKLEKIIEKIIFYIL